MKKTGRRIGTKILRPISRIAEELNAPFWTVLMHCKRCKANVITWRGGEKRLNARDYKMVKRSILAQKYRETRNVVEKQVG